MANEIEQIIKLKNYYLSQLPNKIHVLEVGWENYLAQPDSQKLQVLYRQAYNMGSSASIYGYKEISDTAKKINKLLREQTQISDSQKEKVSELLAKLKTAYQKIRH